MQGNETISGVLFDLDGTLLDTAPDMIGALNRVRVQRGLAPLPYDTLRRHVSHGSAALIRVGFGIGPSDDQFDPLKELFLNFYRSSLADETRPFPGIEDCLGLLERHSVPWGVVTNKPAWLTEPLLEALGLRARSAIVVSGDTTANSKPHPQPLIHACQCMGLSTRHCIYVGDAERDIEAGRRAGMRTIAALFGYIGADEDVAAWGADDTVDDPSQLRSWLERHLDAALGT